MANAIQITAKLYDNRDNVRMELNYSAYKEIVRQYSEPLQGFATRNKVSVLSAALMRSMRRYSARPRRASPTPVILRSTVLMARRWWWRGPGRGGVSGGCCQGAVTPS